jgi:hypothetical protein
MLYSFLSLKYKVNIAAVVCLYVTFNVAAASISLSLIYTFNFAAVACLSVSLIHF